MQPKMCAVHLAYVDRERKCEGRGKEESVKIGQRDGIEHDWELVCKRTDTLRHDGHFESFSP